MLSCDHWCEGTSEAPLEEVFPFGIPGAVAMQTPCGSSRDIVASVTQLPV